MSEITIGTKFYYNGGFKEAGRYDTVIKLDLENNKALSRICDYDKTREDDVWNNLDFIKECLTKFGNVNTCKITWKKK